ncbi:unnamed protein product [Adineta ricciae]|uniref:Uncharacterized protein n=1 Tax=Adineta ricciae TaxID=249248 RepID=A0A814H0J1_ADIRI|nr:unnamed protein product [Adineta ricciae]
MANKKRKNNRKVSVKTVRQRNWMDDIQLLPDSIDKKLLDECSELIQNFIDNKRSSSSKRVRSKSKSPKYSITKNRKVAKKAPKQKSYHRRSKPTKLKHALRKKNLSPSFQYSSTASTNAYPYHTPSLPCYHSYGPIQCPKDKLPMPRDLWYRIVYSQLLEQQLMPSSKRKQKEGSFVNEEDCKKQSTESSVESNRSIDDSSVWHSMRREFCYLRCHWQENLDDKSISSSPRRQQTMNAAFSSPIIATKMLKLDDVPTPITKEESLFIAPSKSHKSYLINHLEYVPETLPLESEHDPGQSSEKTVLSTQSVHTELPIHPKILRSLSTDAALELILSNSNPSVPSIILLHNQPIIEESLLTTASLPSQVLPKIVSIEDVVEPPSAISDHPIYNQLVEYYQLQDVLRVELFKRLNRRLIHIRQALKRMSSNDIEIKLKYKRDALAKKRQTPVESLTTDERLAIAELELNVYEYAQAVVDTPSTQYIPMETTNESEIHRISSVSQISPVRKSAVSIQSFTSTFQIIQPSVISQSVALLSTTATQFSDKTEKLLSWTHPLLSYFMNNLFEHSIPLRKIQIHKQLARRYEHICAKAKEFNIEQLQTQIHAKSKGSYSMLIIKKQISCSMISALVQQKAIAKPTEEQCLRMAELKLCLFELAREQTERNQLNLE